MAKAQIGLARNIKLRWLNKTVQLMENTSEIAELKQELNEYLAFEIESHDNRRKSVDILLNILVREDEFSEYKAEAINLIRKYPDNALPVYWALMLLKYPVFVDTCTVIGKYLAIHGTVTTKQIQQGLFDMWGERTTLLHSTSKVLQTLKDFGALEGTGTLHSNHTILREGEVSEFLLKAAFAADGNSYYPFSEINSFFFLFPFDLNVTKDFFYNSHTFAVHNTGGEMAISLA